MVVGAKVYELTDGFLYLVCGLFVGHSGLASRASTRRKQALGYNAVPNPVY